MDKNAQGEEVFQDITREELIAISYSWPDKVQNSKAGPETFKSEDRITANNVDGVEKIMSELISISNCPPDVSETLPIKSHQKD